MGRLRFLQYIPGKRYNYGIKLFKLCVTGCYTSVIKHYDGKQTTGANISVSTKVVMVLMKPLLDHGRTLVSNNYYTNVSLAYELIQNKIHLAGTLHVNRKHNLPPVIRSRLKKGELKALHTNSKVIVGKWKDQREFLILTTKIVPQIVD